MSGLPVSVSLVCILLNAGPTPPSTAYRSAKSAHVEFLPSIPKDTLPPWRYVDMTRVILEESDSWSPSEVQALELLAWYALVDDRPLYVNVALFGVRLTGGRWALVQMGQNPIPDQYAPAGRANSRTGWNFYAITDVQWSPRAVFADKPTSQQVDAFLRFWPERGGWRVLSRGFRSQTWTAFLDLPAPPKLRALNLDRPK